MRYIKTYKYYQGYGGLTNEELKLIDYILTINESNLNESLIDRLKKIAKKGLLTTAMITSLLASNPTFAKQYNSLPKEEKNQIEMSIKSEKGGVIDASETFESGQYKLSEEGKKNLLVKLESLVEYMNRTNGDLYEIRIESSESLVTNQNGKDGKPLELAKLRAQEMNKFISAFLASKKTPGINFTQDIKKGTTPYKKGDDKNSDSYKKEQYVKIHIEVQKDPDSFCGYTIDNIGSASNGNISFEKSWNTSGKLGSGNVILTPGGIPDRVVVYADGKIIGDSGFFASSHKTTEALGFDYVPKTVYELTNLYIKGDNATKTDKLKIVKCNTIEELKTLLNPKKPDVNWTLNQSPDIGLPYENLLKMFKRGQRDFVIYSKEQVQIPFDLKGQVKEMKVVVYSNVKKSSFRIKVKCSK